MIVKLLIEHHFEFLSLKGGCKSSSKSTLVEMSNCWKPHVWAQLYVKQGSVAVLLPLNSEMLLTVQHHEKC